MGDPPRTAPWTSKAETRMRVLELSFFFFFITLGLELSDTKSLRALSTSPPGTASQYCGAVVLESGTEPECESFGFLGLATLVNRTPYRGTSLMRKRIPLGPHRGPIPRVLGGS